MKSCESVWEIFLKDLKFHPYKMCVLQKPSESTAILFYYKYLKAPNVGLGTDILLLRCVCINTNFVNYCERYEK